MSDGTDSTPDANQDPRSGEVGITDDQLPEELVPGEDNPLAEGLPDGETVEGLLTEKKPGLAAQDAEDGEDDGATTGASADPA